MMRDWFSPPKKPATVVGMIVRFGALFSFLFVSSYLMARKTVPAEVVFIITAAVLAPAVVLSIFQQIRLRRALSRKKLSGIETSN
jgi:ABC-type uncharacterized transport system permease subunit